MAQPDPRKVHTTPTPDIGGIALLIGILAALLLAWQMDRFGDLFDGNSELVGVVIAAVFICGLGLVDDIRDISAPAKVAGTAVAGLVLVWAGVTMFYFRVPYFDVFVLSNDWIPLVTILWLLVMTEAINLIDGLDGLATGIVAIASAAFFVYSRHLGDLGLLAEPNIGPLIAAITCGACIGFLPHNFNPAKIFMGDSGALLLGLMLAVSTSVVGGRADPATQDYSSQTYFFLAPLFIPLLILGVPLFDVAFAIVRRAYKRQSFATADKGHLHHRLMNLGHGQRRSVLILWLWTALLSGMALYPAISTSGGNIAPFGVAAVALGLYTVLHPSVRRKGRQEGDEQLDLSPENDFA
jgi:UDP-GlcNAc:undecaprenyl-phosphate GlcNAc-1-phosphate transferase